MSISDDSKNDSKKCILKAAASLFAKLGLDKCSTREIAKEADANISLISYHFGGKEGLYKEVMRSYALEIKERAQKITGDIDKSEMTREVFITNMSRVVENLINTRVNNPELSKILTREKLAGLPHSKEIHSEIFYPLILNFYKLVEIGQKKGFVKSEINPALYFILLSEAVWGFFVISECNTKVSKDCEDLLKDTDKLKKQVLDIFLTGVLV